MDEKRKLTEEDLEQVNGGGVAEDFYCPTIGTDDDGVCEFDLMIIP